MHKRKILLGGLILAIAVIGIFSVLAQGEGENNPYVGRVPAPEFSSTVDWLNVENPLTFDGLRGKIVLLDFWTYGCINCIHMIPILEQLEEKYAEELVVIGVHSAKFENEGQTDNIRQIVQRYNLHHPVINDSDFQVWGSFRPFGVNAWPTFAVIDPRGNVVAVQSGEVPFEAFDQYLSGMVEYYDNLGTNEIDRTPLEVAIEGAGNPGTPLLFPGKTHVDTEGNRLFIADTNHHRIVIADLITYEVLDIIGTGQRGYTNGAYTEATFDQPQGMTLKDNILYVADVNNHAIRTVDLATQQVSTLAGTGAMGRGILRFGTPVASPTTFDLRSPWDVEMGDDNVLHIAMAGTHQLWSMDLETGTLFSSVGNGREAQLNSTFADSELAQPSGLYYADGLLYFADSESSTIRVADFNNDEVRVVAGTLQNNLFDFGDIDGELGENRLQHALGVTVVPNGDIYIADTYNSKIKVVDPETFEIQTAYGLGGNGGYQDGDASMAEFDEPGGIEYADGKLYVADTNNHVIRVIDLETETVNTIQFPNPQVLAIESDEVTILNNSNGTQITLPEQQVSPGSGVFILNLTLPDDYKINTLIDSTMTINSDGDAITLSGLNTHKIDELQVNIPLMLTEGTAQLNGDFTIYYCRTDDEGLCFIETFTLEVPVTVNADAEATTIELNRDIELPDFENTGL